MYTNYTFFIDNNINLINLKLKNYFMSLNNIFKQ